MSKLILVSNRLATSAEKTEDGIDFKQSMGGLATGLSSLTESHKSIWIGWSGLSDEELETKEKEYINRKLQQEYNSVPVSLTNEELDRFYYGFCNNIIWPLFHYFPTYVYYDENLWNAYNNVNTKYFNKVMEVAEPEDTIWVHDYQLLLLPRMIKQALPESRIGFFLHIPFPSFEIFRLLPWREDILEGLLGADLIGFHTYDYARHFLSSVRRILGHEHNLGNVRVKNRFIKVDVFPMGIDYDKYHHSSEKPEVQKEIENVKNQIKGRKVVLSVDRLDYTKGIVQRLKGFKTFLDMNPQYNEKIILVMIVAPSRTRVPQYQELRREIDELVGEINGTHGTIGWVPIWYFFRAFPFNDLTAMYQISDVLLVTALRDGMNLIAKEYIASKKDFTGSIVISETAGSARELSEALTVNATNTKQIAEKLKEALELPVQEQKDKNAIMHKRLKKYNVNYWAEDFTEKLHQTANYQKQYRVKKLDGKYRDRLIDSFKNSKKRLIFLDYDGTMVPFSKNPNKAVPDDTLINMISALTKNPKNEVVLISGRGKEFLDKHLSGLNINIVAGHGVWLKRKGEDWELIERISNEWKGAIYPIMELFVTRTPGASIEEKDYSLAWHYRNAEPELANIRLSELRDAILSLVSNFDLIALEGNKVVEVKHASINKGRGASYWLTHGDWDFVMAIGDDHTDEDLFTILPKDAYTIKVGFDISNADYFIESVQQTRNLLDELSKVDQ